MSCKQKAQPHSKTMRLQMKRRWCKAIPFFSPFSVVRPTHCMFIFKIGSDVFKPFLCRIGVSVVDSFSDTILILQQHHQLFRHIDFGLTSCCFPGSTAMMLEYQASKSENAVFFLGFFFFQSDRPTQYQETHLTLNETKQGMA